MINDAASAEAAVRSLRYPPQGDRLWGPFYAPLGWGRSIPEYMAEANDQIMSIATIEHPDAIEHIDEIASVDGLDLAFIGPGDLATALEHPGQFDHPEFLAAVAAAEAGLLPSRVETHHPGRRRARSHEPPSVPARRRPRHPGDIDRSA